MRRRSRQFSKQAVMADWIDSCPVKVCDQGFGFSAQDSEQSRTFRYCARAWLRGFFSGGRRHDRALCHRVQGLAHFTHSPAGALRRQADRRRKCLFSHSPPDRTGGAAIEPGEDANINQCAIGEAVEFSQGGRDGILSHAMSLDGMPRSGMGRGCMAESSVDFVTCVRYKMLHLQALYTWRRMADQGLLSTVAWRMVSHSSAHQAIILRRSSRKSPRS